MSARLSDYDYDLPRGLIAQEPLANRADARLLVVNRAEDKVSFFKADGASLSLVKTLPVGKTSRELCVSPDGARAYVSAQEGNSITVLDLDGLAVVSTLTSPNLKSPDGCVVSPDSKKLSTRRQLSSSAARFQPTFIGPQAASVASTPSCRLM